MGEGKTVAGIAVGSDQASLPSIDLGTAGPPHGVDAACDSPRCASTLVASALSKVWSGHAHVSLYVLEVAAGVVEAVVGHSGGVEVFDQVVAAVWRIWWLTRAAVLVGAAMARPRTSPSVHRRLRGFD